MRSGRIMEEEADEPSPGPLDYLFYCFSHSRYGFQLEEWMNTYLSFFNPRSGPRLVRHLPFLLADVRTATINVRPSRLGRLPTGRFSASPAIPVTFLPPRHPGIILLQPPES